MNNGNKSSEGVDKSGSWKKPTENIHKANWDAAFNAKQNKIEVGIVIRDFKGELIAGLSNCIEHINSPKITEINVLGRVMIFCEKLGVNNVILERDAKFIIEEVKAADKSWASYGQLIQEVKSFITL